MKNEIGFWASLAVLIASFLLLMLGHFIWFVLLLGVGLISHAHFHRRVYLKSTDRHKKVKPRDLGRYQHPGRRS